MGSHYSAEGSIGAPITLRNEEHLKSTVGSIDATRNVKTMTTTFEATVELRHGDPSLSRDAVIVAAWVSLVGSVHAWGRWLLDSGHDLKLLAPPLFGHIALRAGPGLLLAAAWGATSIFLLPGLARRAPWRFLIVAVPACAIGWAIALALNPVGAEALTSPLLGARDYLAAVPAVGSPIAFLAHFNDRIATFPLHVQGHPPGAVMLFWALGRIGLGSPTAIAGLSIVSGCSASAAALVAAKSVAGERVARRCAPFLALLPAVLWIATSIDALFLGISAWSVTFIVLSVNRSGWRSALLAALGGLCFGTALLFTYGAAPLCLIPALVATRCRRMRPLAIAAGATLLVLAAPAAAGFWWLDGLHATEARYRAGVSQNRPYGYFLVSNLAAFSLALGPAVLVGLARLRDMRLWLLVGAGLAVVALADLSGLSKGEVERIWLPFTVWVALAASALPQRFVRGWLTGQVALGMLITLLVRSPW